MKSPFLGVRLTAILTLFVLAAANPVRVAAADPQYDTAALSAIALHWLGDWDARNYQACWDAMSPDIKDNIMPDRWGVSEGYYADHLGKVTSRKFAKIEPTMIRGEVVIVEFDVVFEHLGDRSEGIYLEKGSDGSWKVYALVIKPPSAEWPRQYNGDISANSSPLELHATPGLFR